MRWPRPLRMESAINLSKHADRKVIWRTPREVLDALHGNATGRATGDFGEGGSHRYEAVGPEVPCTTSIVARHMLRVTMRPCGHCPMVTRHGHDEFRARMPGWDCTSLSK
jgi:hypothetical protein